MPKAYCKPQNDSMGSDQPCRFSLLDSTGSATSYAANQVFTTTAYSSNKKQSLLPVCNVSEPGFYSRTEMVQQPGDLQWQTNCVSNHQNNNTTKCPQKGLGRGGGVLSDKVNRVSYQCSDTQYLHISVLELLSIKLALLMFSKMFNLKSVHFQVNNMSAPSYLMKMGGTQNKEMIAISKEI